MWNYNCTYDRYQEQKEVSNSQFEQIGIFYCYRCKMTVPHFREKGSFMCRCGKCGTINF